MEHGLSNTHDDRESIIISNKEIPEVAAWRNGQSYDVVKTYKNLEQIRRTEFIDGTVHVELALTKPVIFDGGQAD